MTITEETAPESVQDRLREAAELIREEFEHRPFYQGKWWPIAETLEQIASYPADATAEVKLGIAIGALCDIASADLPADELRSKAKRVAERLAPSARAAQNTSSRQTHTDSP